jgi:hypothetical protein
VANREEIDMAYIANIQLLLDVEDDASACDAVAETLREHLRKFAPDSCIVDWRWSPSQSHPFEVELPPDFESDDTWPGDSPAAG